MLHLSVDRWGVKRDTEFLASRLKTPRKFEKRRMIHVIRYLKGTQGYGHVLEAGRGLTDKIMLDMYTDSSCETIGVRMAMQQSI